MLPNSLWHCHRVLPIEDHTILGDQYLAVIPEDKCIFIIYPVFRDSKSHITIGAISAWYEEVSEYELRFSLITRGGSRWQDALYREQENHIQWFEPRDGKAFNMFGTKLPWHFLTGDYLEALDKAQHRAKKIQHRSYHKPSKSRGMDLKS